MKRMKFTLSLLSLALVSTTFFVSCSDDDVLENKDSNKEQYAAKTGTIEFCVMPKRVQN